MDRVRVAILFGGCSEEHPISVKSAQEVARHLDPARYEPFFVGITTGGEWRLCDGPEADWENGGSRAVVLSPDRSVHGLLVVEHGRCEAIRLDVVLPVLHGKLGEDGAMQGLLELAGVPYAGCDVQSSALCMDKSLAYTVAGAAGIATPRFWIVAGDEQPDPDRLPYPVFVKPARSGSSFGVTKAARAEELPSALAAARRYDAKVLIEEAVLGSEIGCAILGDGGDLLAGEVDQISLSHGFFRIHQEEAPERGSDNSTVTVPADDLRRGACARPGDREGRLPRAGVQRARAGRHVPQGRRTGRPQRGQHAARDDLLQPLPADDAGRGAVARGRDRPDRRAGVERGPAMSGDFVFVDKFVAGIRWDAKYATWDNFTGKPVDGYLANRIVGTRALCTALERARDEAAAIGFGLLLWDGYRPQRAVDCFLRWAQQPDDGADQAAGTTPTSPRPRCSSRATWRRDRPTPAAAPST